MGERLKVYVIEDDCQRVEEMRLFFQQINDRLTDGRDISNSVLGEFLQKNNFEGLEMEELVPNDSIYSKGRTYYNYDRKDKRFINTLKEILKKQEKHFFLLDLALNEEERGDFRRNQSLLRPETASAIISLIMESAGNERRKELVVLNSRYKDLEEVWQRLMGFPENVQEKINIEIMDANSFSRLTSFALAETTLLEKIESLGLEGLNE